VEDLDNQGKRSVVAIAAVFASLPTKVCSLKFYMIGVALWEFVVRGEVISASR